MLALFSVEAVAGDVPPRLTVTAVAGQRVDVRTALGVSVPAGSRAVVLTRDISIEVGLQPLAILALMNLGTGEFLALLNSGHC